MTADRWLEVLQSGTRLSKRRQTAIAYANALLSQSFPIVFSLRHFASIVELKSQVIATMVNAGRSFYRDFTIPKRTGGERIISVPYPALLYLQRWINGNVLSRIPESSVAHGFVRGRSIITNANQHIGQEFLLKLDLENFFPSIGFPRVYEVFRHCGYSNKVSYLFARLCTLEDSLPQGAATSPKLSNIIAKRLDCRLEGLAHRYGLNYTRYADDLSFSGRYISVKFLGIATSIAVDEGFKINKSKTRLLRADRRKMINGIDVTGDKIRLPTHYKRKLRQEIYFLNKFGLHDHIQKTDMLDPMYLERLRGRLAFLDQVEPGSNLVLKGRSAISTCLSNLANVLRDIDMTATQAHK